MIYLLFVKQLLANLAESNVNQCKNVAALQLWVGELEQELKRDQEEATADKKKI
jgi:hypothetical protein